MTTDWLLHRTREIRASLEALRRLQDELAPEQLTWQPPTGGWSIAQVIEHLITSDASYLPQLSHLIQNGRRGDTPYAPTFFGGMLVRSLAPTSARKLPAPGKYKPGPETRPDGLSAYIKLRQEILGLVEHADGIDLRRNRVRSPVLGLIRMNLGDAIMLLVVHTQRHLQQIERVRSHPEFPQPKTA